MHKYFIKESDKLLQFLWSNVFKAVCLFYGITNFQFAFTIENIDKNVLKYIPGCYFFIGKYDMITYIGESENLAGRLKPSHKKYNGERIIIIECPGDYEKAKLIERGFIGIFQPRKNREKGRTKRK